MIMRFFKSTVITGLDNTAQTSGRCLDVATKLDVQVVEVRMLQGLLR